MNLNALNPEYGKFSSSFLLGGNKGGFKASYFRNLNY